MEEEAISTIPQDKSGLPPLTLVLGGARSGKSRFAESLLADAAQVTYIATAEARDDEMRQRIDAHRARRDISWRTVEAPLDVAAALAAARSPVLLDCLTLWLSNLMEAGCDLAAETDRLLSGLPRAAAPVVAVSNEVGQGIVPSNALARRFRDEAGRLNLAVAEVADSVYFLTAGIPARLK